MRYRGLSHLNFLCESGEQKISKRLGSLQLSIFALFSIAKVTANQARVFFSFFCDSPFPGSILEERLAVVHTC
jgi:hypothetical protein